MKNLLGIIAILAAFTFSCQNAENGNKDSKEETKEKTEQTDEKKDSEKSSCCTETVESCKGTITTDSLLANFEDFSDKEVSVCGVVSHVCVHSGKRMFLAAENSEDVVVITSEEKFPKDNLEKKVIINGTVKMVESQEEHHDHEDDDDHIDDEQHSAAHDNTFVVEAKECKVCECKH